MKSYLIGYDLIKPHKDYPELISEIKRLGTWWHCLDSTWIVKSNATATAIRDLLRKHIDSDDKLLVAELTGGAAWTTSFGDECSNWLKTNLSIN